MLSLLRNISIKHSSNIHNVIKRNKAIQKKDENFMIVRPLPDDYDEILCLMHKAYYTEEPTTSSIGFKPTVLFDERTLHGLNQGFSLIARCKHTGEIIGAAVNEASHCWDPDEMDKLACQVQDVKSRQLLHFYAHMSREADLWRKYCVHKIFEITYLFVRKDARGKGLAARLVKESRINAADCGFHLTKVDATSHYTHSTNVQNVIKRNKTNQEKEENVVIMRPIPDDYDEILCLKHNAYDPEEPSASSIGFKPTPLFDEMTLDGLRKGLSLIARCKSSGEILGAALNETSHCWNADAMDKLACESQDVKSRQLLHFYAYLTRAADLWRKYCVDRIFQTTYLFVRKDARGRGIAGRLLKYSRTDGADCGFRLTRLIATNHYTALIAEKQKLKLVADIPYCSYVGADQEPIFKPSDPHKSAKIYVDEEPQKNSLKKV